MTKKTEDWEELVTWEYFNDEEDKTISITQWDARNIEASSGIVLKAFQFSNIIPGE
jgi:hypothetical protein